jgi:hypothetical protein
MQFFNSAKAELKSKQEKVLESRVSELTKIVNVLKASGQFNLYPLGPALHAYEVSLEHVQKNGIEFAIAYRKSRSIFLSNLYHRDIVSILKDGRGLWDSIYDVPTFVETERREQEEEKLRRAREQKERVQEQEQQRIENEKRVKRETLAAEIGVSPEKLAELVRS